MEHIDEQSIKKLIESGKYDLDLISFEFDIPMEQLEKYKEEIEEEKRRKTTQKSIREKYKVDPKSLKAPIQSKDSKSKNAYTKIEKMRAKYSELTQITKKEHSVKEVKSRKRYK